ncbi:hypothetical protein V1517DRAFT_365763 [Lipomyces orientalis]|uniref:Uncharacterized protein n=1 Tax=Lipomyces orientalis TaxID=1233043 RepID=A0ACC3TVH3_9ASCO
MAGRSALGRDRNFLFMLGIIIVATGPYRATLRSTGVEVMPTNDSLNPGHYDIRPYSRRGSISGHKSLSVYYPKTITGRHDFFRNRAAHIFLVSSEEYWLQSGLSRWIKNRMGEHDTGINSSQNGLLMLSNIHQSFDGFHFSINPDDGYKITCFDFNPFKIDGSGADGARDTLLRWHFRQAVLANMRGAGEPIFEMDFPPQEAELFSRLNGISFV